MSNTWKCRCHLSFSRKSTITVTSFVYYLIMPSWLYGCHKAYSVLPQSLECTLFISSNLRDAPEFADDRDPNSVANRPKWGDIFIPLRVNWLFCQYSGMIFWHQQRSKLSPCTASMICRWNLGTRPPIRINDISSWTYDINTFLENPSRSMGPSIKSSMDFTITGKLSWWKWWPYEI